MRLALLLLLLLPSLAGAQSSFRFTLHAVCDSHCESGRNYMSELSVDNLNLFIGHTDGVGSTPCETVRNNTVNIWLAGHDFEIFAMGCGINDSVTQAYTFQQSLDWIESLETAIEAEIASSFCYNSPPPSATDFQGGGPTSWQADLNSRVAFIVANKDPSMCYIDAMEEMQSIGFDDDDTNYTDGTHMTVKGEAIYANYIADQICLLDVRNCTASKGRPGR